MTGIQVLILMSRNYNVAKLFCQFESYSSGVLRSKGILDVTKISVDWRSEKGNDAVRGISEVICKYPSRHPAIFACVIDIIPHIYSKLCVICCELLNKVGNSLKHLCYYIPVHSGAQVTSIYFHVLIKVDDRSCRGSKI